MATTTTEFKNGLTIEYNNGLYSIVSFLHVKPGKGGAFVRTKLKNIGNGKVLDVTFNAGVNITTATIRRKPYIFLYSQGEKYSFIDETGDVIELDKKMIENYKLLTEGQTVDILFHEEKNKIVGVKLPETIEVELKEVDPSTKGNTVTQATKKARTENGFEIIVPLFIEEGDIIKINTTTGEYKERVKKK